MNDVIVPDDLRLLAGTRDGQPLDLAAHRAVHGELSWPAKHQDEHWRRAVLHEVKASGLTGRGGAAFPTGIKLEGAMGWKKRCIVAINVMEGEPAAKKDSVLAAYAPHLILDGAEVLATVLDASDVVLAVGRDNRGAMDSLYRALAERASTRGSRVRLKVVSPPARYVAGEESALSSWLDGSDARPTFRPDRPAVLKVGGRRCYVENAETAADIALIARHGGAWFGQTGGGQGTALASVSGAVNNSGVFEVPLGTPLGQIVARATPRGRSTGLLLGGYGGTFVGPEALDAPWSNEGLRPFGGAVGAGVIVVIDDSCCGIAEIARITQWMSHESAGQCGPCAFGLPALATDLILAANASATGRLESRLVGLLAAIDGRGACAHPDGVARMVRTGLSVFAADLEAHLGGRRCAASSLPSVLSLPENNGVLEWR